MHAFPREPENDDGDQPLVSRCVAGDPLAQRKLFQAHKRRVHATLYRILGSNAFMDDLVQESFLNVFRSLRTFRGESTLATWIDRCVVRVAYLHMARRGPKTASLELVADFESDAPSAERRVLAREAARRFYGYLERLEPKLRIAFTLHAIDGRPLAEVASLMSSSLVSAKARVWRARRLLTQRARKDPAIETFVGGAELTEGDTA